MSRCYRCKGFIIRDNDRELSCLQCGRKQVPVVPLDIPANEVKSNRPPKIGGMKL